MHIVITHHNADLDALASMIAAAKLFDATPVRGRAVSPPVQRYLALHKDRFPMPWYHDIDPHDISKVSVVDVRDRRRLAEYEPILERDPPLQVFDHHPPSAHDLITPDAWVEPTGACVTLLVERLREANVALDVAEATVMMLGLYADTGSLCFGSTTPRDVDAASWLLRQGARLPVVHRYLQEQFSPEQRALLIGLLGDTREVSIDAVEIAICPARAERFVRGASAVVHRVMQMGGHDAIVGVIEFCKNKRVQFIGRSSVPYVDMNALLGPLGGGGHAAAAAATLKRTSLDDALDQLAERLRAVPMRPTRVRDLMSAPVQTIDHRTTLGQLEELFHAQRIRGAPVTREGELCGIISARDIKGARDRAEGTGDPWRDLPVSGHMTHEVVTIPPDEPLEDALEMMTDQDIGRLVVTHEDDRMIGIVSRSDLIARLYDRPPVALE